MAEQTMADKLLAEGFQRTGPAANALNDPIADTPMVITLEQLHPYDLNPRVTRNRLYDEIKASIRERGLDAPPAITRRPGEPTFIIRNGGNTRLAILHELWAETKQERFFRISCLFRPWPARGEIIALTGHLAENELHGGLTFIERSLGVEKARELYEQEIGKALSQSELSRRLAADGYPVAQPHISRMQDTVRYLLPAIPSILYAGLGRPQVEKLTWLRKAGLRIWEQRSIKPLQTDFSTLFQEVLALFDGDPSGFSIKRLQDELVGQMAELLEADYDMLTLEMSEAENRRRVLTNEPSINYSVSQHEPKPSTAISSTPASTPSAPPTSSPLASRTGDANHSAVPSVPAHPSSGLGADDNKRLEGHIVSPAPTTKRLQSIQRLVADHTGEKLPDFSDNVLLAIPVQAGGLYPVTDVWFIESGLDAPAPLRIHIAQFAREIAAEAGLEDQVEAIDTGIGFLCIDEPELDTPFGRVVQALLRLLSAAYRGGDTKTVQRGGSALTENLAELLQGTSGPGRAMPRLSDTSLVKLFRLIRLARRLLELESQPVDALPNAPIDT